MDGGELLGLGYMGLIVSAILSWLFVYHPRLLHKCRASWQLTADKLGLSANISGPLKSWTMQGVVSGYEVDLRAEKHDQMLAVVKVSFPPRLLDLLQIQLSALDFIKSKLVSDIQVGIPSFDRWFRVCSTAPSLVQALFTDERVCEWASEHDGLPQSNACCIPGGVQRHLQPLREDDRDHLEERIVECIALIELFTDALDRFSDALASRTQLAIVPEVARNLPRFEGTRDGVHIDLRQPATGDGLQLTATPATPVEPTLTIVAQQADNASLTGARVPMLDPILDAHVHVSTKQPEATRALLTQDQTREDILALMMAHPNARVHHGTVTLHVPTVDPDTVAAALDDVVALAASLSTPRAGEVSRAGAAAVAKVVR